MALLPGFAALVLLRGRPVEGRSAVVLAALAVLLCAFAGLTLPDLDQPLPLDHRSAVTHSIGPALLPLIWRWARPAAAGLALGIGLHLAADVFPNAMIGYATVKLPFLGSIGPSLSYLWLAANALAATLLGAWLLRVDLPSARLRAGLLLAVAVMGAIYLFTTDGGWPALAIYAAAGWLLWGRGRFRRSAAW